MNVFLAQELSVYQLALGVQPPPQPLPFSPATLLSLVRSHIDILIEQEIVATLWVKLPPGKIWHSEIQRYQQQINTSDNVINFYTASGRESKDFTPPSSHLQMRNQPARKSQREYFLIVLSPQFCSLVVTYRTLKKRKSPKTSAAKDKKTLELITINTFEGRVIQPVLNGIQLSLASETPSLKPADFVCPSTLEPTLINQLLVRQVQRQDEISHETMTKRLAKVKQQNQKLQYSVQLKDEYLINVCQELRIPLTHMKTALSLLNSPNLKAPQRQRYLHMLNNQCDRQNALITGVLDMLQLERNAESMPLEPVRLSDVVPGVVSIYQPLAREKGIMLAYTVPPELPPIWCVAGGLRQIVINLLSNSIKFTTTGGQVWVRARLQGEFVQLEFRDTGIGIAESEIPKIFEHFYRVRLTATDDLVGVGLGLTIVQHLLRRCGGSISVKSKLYEGSTFTVQLPIANDTAE